MALSAIAVVLTSCGQPSPERGEPIAENTSPPAMPNDAETVVFERPSSAEVAAGTGSAAESDAAPARQKYWGVKEGEALTIMWEDLMPEGSEEALMREYEEFYAMLEKRYAANTTSLADAEPYAVIAEGSEFDFMPQLGGFETVKALNGEHVRIPGYIVPFDFNSKFRQREFLFVPYMGACIHTPPPPPNQIIFIRADPPVRVKDIWVPYWVEGLLSTEKTENDIGDTAYSLEMNLIEPYQVP